MSSVSVSPEDADLAIAAWYPNNGYARLNLAGKPYMHRVIAERMGLAARIVDHINGNTFDNRRCNLRDAGLCGNARNQTRKTSGSSRFKGVYWAKWANRWRAEITVERKAIKLGYFADEQSAQDAYAAAAIKYFGAFAAPRVEKKTP